MGRMVGGYNVYQAGVDGCTQGIAVGLLLIELLGYTLRKDCCGSAALQFFKNKKETPDRKSTRLNSSHIQKSRMPSSA